MPKSRLEFWKPKLEGNRARDTRWSTELTDAGWTVMTVWECQLKDAKTLPTLIDRIRAIPPRKSRP